MQSLLAGLPQHGYSILFIIVFLEAVGLPIPAPPALLIAGAASAHGSLDPLLASAYAVSAMLLGDTIMFVMGRYTGWWLLSVLCRLSLNPESCILRSADSFHRRGRIVLVFAKFVPGINTMAPPLAGSMNMRFVQFLGLDFLGAVLYTGAYFSAGFVFSGVLASLTRGYETLGSVVTWLIIAAIAAYAGAQLWMWYRARRLRAVPMAHPLDVAQAVASGGALIYDVRSHGYYDRKSVRIQGSSRLEPSAVRQLAGTIPGDKHLYLYCTCARQATSVMVARELLEKGIQCSVIEGGLRGWKKAGLPLEPIPPEEMVAMPVFNS